MTTPGTTVCALLSATQDRRVQLPAGTAGEQLWVGAVGYGWVELSSDPGGASLSRMPVTVDDRNRLRLPRGGVAERFGAGAPHPLLSLVADDDSDRSRWVAVIAMPFLLEALASYDRPALLRCRDWTGPWHRIQAAASAGALELGTIPGGAW